MSAVSKGRLMHEPEGKTRQSQGQKILIPALAFVLALVTFLVYLPAMKNGFVNWDDSAYVYQNLSIRYINAGFFKKVFTTASVNNWHPVTTISYALDYSIWGLNPRGYHLVNIIFHALNTFLVFILALRLAGKNITSLDVKPVMAGIATALLFGLHPVHVESVAWISERKDVLSVFFFLLSLLSYLKYNAALSSKRVRIFYYCSTIFFFIIALMSKPMAVSLPFVLLILDFYPLERFLIKNRAGNARVLLEKAPFFSLSILSALITIFAQRGALKPFEAYPLYMRMAAAVRAYGFYIYKMAIPLDLAPFYPPLAKSDFFDPFFALSVLFFSLITIFCLLTFKRKKIFSAVWLYYIITLFPVIGVIQAGEQSAADRYTYMPSIGPFILAGVGLVYLIERCGKKFFIFASASVIAAISIALSVLTVKQEAVWKDSVTLWSHEIKLFPGRAAIAYNDRGEAYRYLGDFKNAINDFNISISLDPGHVFAYNNRGLAYQSLGDFKSAIRDYSAAISLNPRHVAAYNNRGLAYQSLGDFKSAIRDYSVAISLDPENTSPYNNRGISYEKLGDYSKAIEDYNAALSLDPRNPDLHINRGISYSGAGQYERAIDDFKKALEFNDRDADAYYYLGQAYSKSGDMEKAAFYLEKASALGLKEADVLRSNLSGQ